jgi:hypothetical protein
MEPVESAYELVLLDCPKAQAGAPVQAEIPGHGDALRRPEYDQFLVKEARGKRTVDNGRAERDRMPEP